MKKLLFVLAVSMLVCVLTTEVIFACQLCSFYTVDGERRTTCATTPAGSKTCTPAGSNCIQTADCCGCRGGGGGTPGGGGTTCLTRVLIDCLSTNEPSKHHMPEFGIIIWQPQQQLDGDNN